MTKASDWVPGDADSMRANQALSQAARRCGSCDYWEFGHRSYCSWGFFPGALAISSAYKAGGECHAMAASDGKDCPTWVARSPQERENG
ncbi:hypothetical protein [Bradyrhizobium sp. AUGA SZCCT0160]|uniref:hypothetical protein n=1 Tax=Bradyrhizobium sp. AUGA SZCCT0160 TaxID=2807662 RepID=UPI001BA90BCE|nr:hypothetical protein [Bradyrhizobium sp. AUGA SZCCT0160]MBR1193194.1 hypothetical protein [Bradyrhizobium sp. AUGA SZCCT0160]